MFVLLIGVCSKDVSCGPQNTFSLIIEAWHDNNGTSYAGESMIIYIYISKYPFVACYIQNLCCS